jgi:hypothetical protein
MATSQPVSPIVVFAVVAALGAGVFGAVFKVRQMAQALPVQTASASNVGAAPLKPVTAIYPVWVERALAARSAPAPTGEATAPVTAAQVEKLFVRAPQPVVAAPVYVEPDYAQILRYSLTLDALASDGAYLNGVYYKTGTALTELAWYSPSRNRQLIPRLTAIGKHSATVQVDGKTIELKLASYE